MDQVIVPLPITFLLIVPIQLLFWVGMWFLVAWFDRRRRERALARGEHAPHWNELMIVLGIISTIVLLGLYAVSFVRPIW
jgi:hypothetical protein